MRLDKLTTKSQEALQQAQSLADKRNHQAIDVEHLLFALIGQREGVVLSLLQKLGVPLTPLTDQLQRALDRLPQVTGATTQTFITPRLKKIIEGAEAEAEALKDEYVSTEHLLLSMVQDGGDAGKILKELGASRDKILSALVGIRGAQRITDPNPEEKYQALEKYSRDLTDLARKGKLDPVIGRDDEIRRVIQVLSRRTKNNPVLIGEPGVGKTAIVEGLAARIVEGEIVTFIDELHTVVGAGAAEGAIDAGNMLKPLLARGELRMIGATTLDEYRKHIEKDAALERRFQQVYVGPPSVDDTIAILRGLKERYEVHHGVRIQDAALVAAAVLSDRYLTGRFLPDKAIDLVDEAASRLRIEIDSLPTEIDVVERRIRQLEIERVALAKETDEVSAERLAGLDEELANLREQRDSMLAHWNNEKEAIGLIRELKEQLETRRSEVERETDLERAAEIRYGQIPELERQVEAATRQLEELQSGGQRMLKEEVDEEDVAEVVSRWTGVPVSRLMEGEMAKLVRMEQVLHERVVGQDEAVTAVAHAIRRSRAGLSDPHRPIGSFLFLGPTGVGKTELARALAEFLFDDERAMVRIDMSEYMEKHTVARLIGAPPGYVGYEEGGQLTEAVRRRPYAVLLLDEIEKAHSDVFNVLLQIMDDGRLTDGQGRTVDFTNTILIMTSNVGSQFIAEQADEERMREQIEEVLAATFKPEFLNRIDDVVIFQRLTRDDIGRIVDLQVAQLAGRVEEKGIRIELTDDARTLLSNLGYDPTYGARPLKRVIQRQLVDKLALALLEGEFREGDRVQVDAAEGELAFEKAGTRTAAAA